MDVPKAGCLVQENRERLLAHPSKAHKTAFEILLSSHGHFFSNFFSGIFFPPSVNRVICIFLFHIFTRDYRNRQISNERYG